MKKLVLPSTNLVIISGRLTRNGEVRYIPSGAPVLGMSMAHSKRYKDQHGQWQEQTHYYELTMFGKITDYVSPKALKGVAVMVTGELLTQTYQDKNTNANIKKTYINVSKIDFMEREVNENDPAEDNSSPVPASYNTIDEDVPF